MSILGNGDIGMADNALFVKASDRFAGVGTTSPVYKFQVGNGPSNIADHADQNADIYSTGGITMQGDKFLSLDDTYKVHANMTYEEGSDEVHQQGRFRLEGYYGFRFVTESAHEAMMIKGDNGYVGINTTNPTSHLHVSGTLKSTNSRIESNNPFIQFVETDTENVNWQVSGNATKFRVHSINDSLGGHIERFTIRHNGYVGINITKPTAQLHVNGTIKAPATDWSDFVFEEDYDLPTLEEVASHIETHGHLKDITSEEEVYENDVDLTQMDAKLLQKIEELTLYLIE